MNRRNVTFVAMVTSALLTSGLATAQKGKKGNRRDIVQNIPVEMTMPVPAATSAGTLESDATSTSYADAEKNVDFAAGHTAGLRLALRKKSTRSMHLQLGGELQPLPGDGNNARPNATAKVDFFTTNNVPDPSGVITDLGWNVGWRENVSALGAYPVLDSRPPNYCDPGWMEIDDQDVDPDVPDTFSRMCTTMRITFKSGKHEWRLYFGAPTRRVSPGFAFSHPDAGAVHVQRILPSRDPLDPTVDWEIQAMPWNTQDVNHDRYGKIVGFLFYRGTTGGSPQVFAGAFAVHWADTFATRWKVRPQ